MPITISVLIGFIAAIALDVALAALHYEYARRNYVARPAAVVDALIVPFSGSLADGSLDAETRRRLNWAYAIYRGGLARAIICSGGQRRGIISGAARMRDYLVAEGVSGTDIVAEGSSFDTITNVRRSIALAMQHKWGRLAIVSSPLHVPRVLRIASVERNLMVAAGYDPGIVDPPLGRLEVLAQVHHEWLAAIAALLPEFLYLRELERWRVGASEHTSHLHRFAFKSSLVMLTRIQ